MTIQRFITVQVFIDKPAAVYKDMLNNIEACYSEPAGCTTEEWTYSSPTGTAVVRFETATESEHMQVEGTFQCIEQTLDKLNLSNAARFVQAITIVPTSEDDFLGACPSC